MQAPAPVLVYQRDGPRQQADCTPCYNFPYVVNFHDFKAWQPFTFGEFTITPYLVDHSATDAYAFLIEAEGKRLFYSGDLRSHVRCAQHSAFLCEGPRQASQAHSIRTAASPACYSRVAGA